MKLVLITINNAATRAVSIAATPPQLRKTAIMNAAVKAIIAVKNQPPITVRTPETL